MKLTKEQKIDLLKDTSPEEIKEILTEAKIDLPELASNDKELNEAKAKIAELEKTQMTEDVKAKISKVEELEKQLADNKIDAESIKKMEEAQKAKQDAEAAAKEAEANNIPKPMSAVQAATAPVQEEK